MTGTVESELLRAERSAALREALTQLPPDSRRLIALLIQDPPVPYAEISVKLGIPVGSIGPLSCPLPAEAAPPSSHRRADQRRSPNGIRTVRVLPEQAKRPSR
jgi:hypothetical protein